MFRLVSEICTLGGNWEFGHHGILAIKWQEPFGNVSKHQCHDGMFFILLSNTLLADEFRRQIDGQEFGGRHAKVEHPEKPFPVHIPVRNQIFGYKYGMSV